MMAQVFLRSAGRALRSRLSFRTNSSKAAKGDYLFQNTILEGRRCDLRVSQGRIQTICSERLKPLPHEVVRTGGMVTPPFAEPHVHLDAALLVDDCPNESGTLFEGIRNWARIRDALSPQNIHDRAIQTAELYASYGTLFLRTHMDTGSLSNVEAMLSVKQELKARGIVLQIVAFPQEGILRKKGLLEQWQSAVALGCDAVGAIPHYERTTEEGWNSVRLAFDLAEQHDCMIDMHCDESDDGQCRNLEVVCAETLDRGFQGRVVAGHCTALHSAPDPYVAKIVSLIADADVQVVANPLDNVWLQGRFDRTCTRRGLAPVRQLWEAGALVGVGHDSVQDPWYPLGTANMVDAAYMLVHLGHLTSLAHMRRAFALLHTDNHRPFGGPPELTEGKAAALLWWEQEDEVEILRERPRPLVLRG